MHDAGANFAVASGPEGDRFLMLKSVYEEPEPNGATGVTTIVHFDKYL